MDEDTAVALAWHQADQACLFWTHSLKQHVINEVNRQLAERPASDFDAGKAIVDAVQSLFLALDESSVSAEAEQILKSLDEGDSGNE